jgi:Pyruvate/2-oxoacid:ferredoxin oxidoreductase delta subunit/DNA-binding MarR family transcriptional regulator
MNTDVYRALQQRLDEIPNGFPATESGIELKLLAKLFTEEEAHLASLMKLKPESYKTIAERVELDKKKAVELLKGMAKRGLIRFYKLESGVAFGLRPWIVGVYEAQLEAMDEELARLVEAHFKEVFGRGVLPLQPALHRVITVEQAIPFELEVFPYETAYKIVDEAKSFAVRDCICRVQKEMIDEKCDYPVEACLLMAPKENAFKGSGYRELTKDEAKELLKKCQEAGLVHTSSNVKDGVSYICNCCPCCCGILRGVTEFGIQNSAAFSGFVSEVDETLCTGCETCLERCHFKAVAIEDDVAHIVSERCAGCGLCVPTCPSEAIHMKRREDVVDIPENHEEWDRERAKKRGISLDRVL